MMWKYMFIILRYLNRSLEVWPVDTYSFILSAYFVLKENILAF